MSQDVMICVMNSTAVFDDVNVEMQSSESCVKCLDLDAEHLNKQNAYNDLSKSHLQAKGTTICKLKEYIKSMRENDKEKKFKHEMDEIETINIELEHSVAKLLSENERLHKEIKPLKKIYKDQFDSIKKTRALSKEHGSNAIDVPSSSSLVNDRLSRQRAGYGIFGTINKLAKDGLARGIPKLKFQIDHLSLVCALGKNKKSSHQPKVEDTNQEKLYLLHMYLCGPMRVESINGKKYILVIVDDYSRFTWVRFFRSKDEAPDAIIKCIKNIQVCLNATVRNVRTDNGTEFVNQTLRDFYENVGISHQTFVARTPQQNGIVQRRNRTLVEAARTMLIFSKASLFLWAEAINTACYTQNRSLIRLRYNKTPYELMHDKKLDLSFLHVFGSLYDWDRLFQPMFDEYFNPTTIDVSPVLVAATPRAVDTTESPVSTSTDLDAPSISMPSTQEQEHSLIISHGFEESPKTPHFHDDPLHEDSTSQGSSSNVRPTHTLFEHHGRWTKDHPIANVIGDPSRSVFTRKQLETDTM
ncbi:retrovirus-related pol polyprotein from transposon TNT 1-94 [Tanacetum coccineum]